MHEETGSPWSGVGVHPRRSYATDVGRQRRGPGLRAHEPVPRVGLVRRLLASEEPVVSVVAPPGYGKSILLKQWAERRGPALAWVSCDKIHDDPVFLWTAIVAALSLVEPLGMFSTLPVTDDTERFGRYLAQTIGVLTQPVTLVLDQLETVSSAKSLNLIAALAMALPEGSRLAWASREAVPFSLAQMHVQHRVLELGVADLAMSRGEASLLLHAAGVEITKEETDHLVGQTEGWPAALYLAALQIRTGEAPADQGVSGNDRLLRDYLRSEVLDHLHPRQVEFLLRTSILEMVNGDLGDALGGRRDSIGLLDRLRSRNSLVEPVDSRGEWYRYHPLLRQMLQGELNRDSPELLPELHARAAVCFEAAGDMEAAIDHANLAGDADGFVRLAMEAMQRVWATGRVDIVESWMERLGRRSPEAHTPAMIAHGALLFALLGRPGDAERWSAVAELLPATGTLPDGSSVAATMAYLRANLCREGPAVMRRDSVEALEGLSPTSPYRTTMLHTQGLAALLDGDLDQAETSFAHAYDVAVGIETPPVAALVLTEQFLVAVERDEWAAAEALIKRSLEIVTRGPFDAYWSSAVVYAAAAHAAVHRGALPEARQHLVQATELRPLLTYALPVVSVQALLELGRTYLGLLDQDGLRSVLDQIHGILQQRPQLGTLVTATQALDERLVHITSAPTLAASTLTPAELRLVPLLATRMTMAEIGEGLFLSRNTVKTQGISIYRKLGVSTRSEAVDRLLELGLL